MKRQKIKIYDRTCYIFFSKLMKYGLFYFISLFMLIPLIIQSYSMAKQMTFDKYKQKMEVGMKRLENQIQNSGEIVNVIQKNISFRKILLMSHDFTNADYISMQKLRELLGPLFLTIRIKEDAWLIFRNTSAFFLNGYMTDDYRSLYPGRIGYTGMSADEWRNVMLETNEKVRFLPERKITSYLGSKTEYDGITVIINAGFSSIYRPSAVLAYTIDKEEILHSLLDERGVADCMVYLCDESGEILLSHNYNRKYPLEATPQLGEIQLDNEKYILTICDSKSFGMNVVVGIPKKYFMQNIRGMVHIVFIYAFGGGLLLAVITFILTLLETKKVKRMYETAKNYSGLIPDVSDEHEYVGRVLNQMSLNSKEQRNKIKVLRDSIHNSVLENLLLFGIYTHVEEKEVEEYFGSLFERFCVIKTELVLPDEENADLVYLTDLMYVVENTLITELTPETKKLVTKPDQLILIVPLSNHEKVQQTDIQVLLEEMILEIQPHIPDNISFHIGISEINHGMTTAKTALLQAKNAVGMLQTPELSEVICYQEILKSPAANMFDASMQMKLYDAIIAGADEIVERIFDETENGTEDTKVFYSLLHAVEGAENELKKIHEEKEDWPVLPASAREGEEKQAIKELRQGCKKMMEIVHNRKKHKNSELKLKVMEYIQDSFPDPGLSAASIASALFISEKYVFYLVKDETGKTLSKYIEDLRVSKAEEYLLYSDFSNLEIMKLCGFGSPKTFYRAFAKKHSVSPAVWRESRKQMKDGQV